MKILPISQPPRNQAKQRSKHRPCRDSHNHGPVPDGDKLQHEVKEHRQVHPACQADDEASRGEHLPRDGETTDEVTDGQQEKGQEEGRFPADQVGDLPRYEAAGQESTHLDCSDGGGDPFLVTNQVPL